MIDLLVAINTTWRLNQLKTLFHLSLSDFLCSLHINTLTEPTLKLMIDPPFLYGAPLFLLPSNSALHQPSSNLPNHIQGLPIYARERFNLHALHPFSYPIPSLHILWLYNSPAGRFKEEDAGLLQAVHSRASRCHGKGKSMDTKREVTETVSLLLGGTVRTNEGGISEKAKLRNAESDCIRHFVANLHLF